MKPTTQKTHTTPYVGFISAILLMLLIGLSAYAFSSVNNLPTSVSQLASQSSPKTVLEQRKSGETESNQLASTAPTQVSAVQLLQQVADRSGVIVKVNDITLDVELVNSPESITQGLSDRPGLRTDGMLFALPHRDQIPTFWMKDMLFPIDIVWIGGTTSSTIVDISADVQPPDKGTVLKELPRYSPRVSASMVLELGAGRSERLGLEPGMTVEYFLLK